MKQLLNLILKPLIHWAYPQFKRPEGYMSYIQVFRRFFIFQKLLGFNRKVPWPVHFTSTIYDWRRIEKGICCDPADNPGIYINAGGGLIFGDDIEIGPNTVITTVNHYKYDYRKTGFKKGVVIGSHVWIGANCSITAGVTIGDNVTVGAGCVIRQNIPSNTLVTGSSDNLTLTPKRDYEWDCSHIKFM